MWFQRHRGLKLLTTVLIVFFGMTGTMALRASVQEGDTFPLLSEFPLEGELPEEMKGKIVLIDFWASWCGPCRKEIPNMKHDYAEFHDKGFEIFSISIDKSEAAWRKASAKENLPWPNSIKSDDPKKDAQKTYNVSAIPANFLIGPDGTIVARNLRGKMLTKKLEELLN